MWVHLSASKVQDYLRLSVEENDRMNAEHRGPRFLLTTMLYAFSFASVAAGQTPADKAAAAAVPGNFVDTTAASGVNFEGVASHTSKKYLMETMGSGVALFDYDNDGLLDIFFVNGAPLSDPTAKGTIPAKAGAKGLEPALPPEKGRDVRGCNRKGGVAGRWVWHGCRRGGLR